MSVSIPRRCVVLGLVDLERQQGRDHGWDLADVLVAATRRHSGSGPWPAPTEDDVRGLLHTRPAFLHQRSSDGRWELTEVGRQRAREGSW